MHRLQLPHTRQIRGRWYFRRGDRSAPLGPLNPATDPETAARYWALVRGDVAAPAQHDVAACIRSYMKSPRWTRLKPGSQKTYLIALRWIEDKAGKHDIRSFQRHHIITMRDQMSGKSGAANLRLAVFGAVFEHAIDCGYRRDNPCKGVQTLDGGQGHLPWPEWAIEAARQWDHPWFRTYLELGIGTGQRPGDLRKMRWADIEDGGINVVQEKTGAELWIPFTGTLAAYLGAMPRTVGTIIAWPDCSPVSKAQAQYAMVKLRQHDKRLVHYSAHGWRYNAVTELYDHGCTDAQVRSITGQKSNAMAIKYGAKAGQKLRAKQAQERRK